MTALKEKEQPIGTATSKPRKICFVCTGNTCRSPMAAAVANALAEKSLQRQDGPHNAPPQAPIAAISAGLYAAEGEPISRNAIRALEAAGIKPTPLRDYRLHRAHNLTEEEACDCDLLVAMTPSHAMELLLRFPAVAQRITAMPRAIPDPYGGDGSAYEKCLSEILEGVRRLLFGEADL